MIHHTALIDRPIDIGEGTKVGAFTEIREGVVIGDNCYIDSHCCFTGNSKIGNNVTIRNHCVIARGVEIGDNTFISPQCMFQNLDKDGQKIGGAKIGKDCFIGTNVTFKEGVKVCDGVTIGSKSYVNKDITEPGLYVGIPAKLKK
jgi:UDP-3-O-[3-hydroxymyristoyl] glucosamine N-acyltransferase